MKTLRRSAGGRGGSAPLGPAGTALINRRRPRGRPQLYTSYKQDTALLDTPAKRRWLTALLVASLLAPFMLTDDILALLAAGLVASIGAIGLNIVTGYAGQISLGHAFFLAIGAYTGAAISGDPDGDTIGFGITFLPVWLLAAGLAAALAGVIVAPLATRLRGLYLAVVTLGLVFLGGHIFKEWDSLTGGPGVGRPAAVPELFGVRLDQSGAYSKEQKLYLLMLVLLVVFAVLARNLMRSRIGRAFAAVRDRDIAAAIIGVDLRRTKLLAFAISSFYAGIAGGLMYTVAGYFDPGSFDLLLSVQFIAMILIGGTATISGSIMGAMFITLLPRLTRELPGVLPFISSESDKSPNIFQVESVLYGLLIIVFLILEPRGLFGVWTRIRNYWKAWPFSY
ncbi:branched-chain amino acid ABC transporter permease [Actinomadura barringtoniae]|uniref:Branched-chain amino acid ABC transporter permease n=1 Tax=Actinomadura barringtoniae TaxID=1427535 RepID=A0A939PNG5_9ACTN|nr:branched-chain amino acid ABC transporter permease [Actinomadura barringtoniae]MBO2455465.1 branched-chain amino acid ABC transporter permease [Actinomadura barringtoniae]